MLVAMGIAAGLCIFIGCFPRPLYSLLPVATDYTAYDATHVIAQLQLLFFSALAFVWLKLTGLYPPELRSVNLDAEWIYRKLGGRAARGIRSATGAGYAHCARVGQRVGRSLGERASDYFGPNGNLAGPWAADRMVIVVVLALGGLLMFLYAV